MTTSKFLKYYDVKIADGGYEAVKLVISEYELGTRLMSLATELVTGVLDGPVTITLTEREFEGDNG